jgi:PAS domain S-box-containing protein
MERQSKNDPRHPMNPQALQSLLRENIVLRNEIRVAREAAEITASLVVKQFEETERILRRFQDANAQRKAVLDSAVQIAIVATDRDGIITVFNTGAENLLGYRAREVIGIAKPDLFHLPQEMERHAQLISAEIGRPVSSVNVFPEYAKKGINEQQEWTCVRKNGETFPVNLTINALKDPEGAINGFLCIAMDITEKKRSEKALAESERNYRLLIDNIPNIVFKGYADGSIDFFDDKIETLTGYSRELFASRWMKWQDLIVEEDRAEVKRKFVNALKGDKSYIREYRIRKKNGDMVWIEACSQIVCDDSDSIEFVTGAFLDITERKHAEQALHESEEKYRSLFDSGPNPIFVLDRKTLEILDANPSAEETYGYNKQELIGKSFLELGAFDYDEEPRTMMQDAQWQQWCVLSHQVRHYRKTGKPFYAEVKACPAAYREKPAIILAATDITQTVEKDAQLFQASKMTTLGEMSAGIAHELNQPLNTIKIGNDYLKTMIGKGRAIPHEKLLQVVTMVTRQVERASDIIHRLREFGRKPDFKKERVSINATIQEVMAIIGQQLVLQNIEVKYDLDEGKPVILANKNRMEQVIFNLVTNARDAIEHCHAAAGDLRARIISLTTHTTSDAVFFSIADTGSGIPEDFKEKIFEPFFTTKEVGRGMGLGLAITYGIVRDFGGAIDLNSSHERGTCFTLRFPRAGA